MVVLSVSIMIHKIPVGFSVGTSWHKHGKTLKECSTVGFFLAFMLATPIGIVIGMIVEESMSSLVVLCL